MMRLPTLRFALALPLVAAAGSPLLHAQIAAQRQKPSAALPATAPTSFVAATPAASTSLTPAQRPAHRADVKFANGELAVNADNSSLNQILREIGRTTGIKITGGVADERVFGKYGPSPAPDVLNALLDGTGSNLLIVETDGGTELILTPRHGGITPPNPNAPGFDDEAPAGDDPQTTNRPAPPPATAPVANQAPASTAPQSAPAAATDATDPNAVKTPQQIFEQLQRLRQQQQAPPPQ